jgi:hypothetical protein
MSTGDANLPRYPKRRDRLFPPVENWAVEIPATPEGRAEFMIIGYKRAADELVEKALSDPALELVLVYPIVYCYRQFIELFFKYHLRKFGDRAGLSSKKLLKTHDLRDLLRKFLMLDKDKITNAFTQSDMCYFMRLILEFHKIDPKSFVFRFPDGEEGRSEFMSTKRIDLENLKDVMAGIATLFISADGELDSFLSDEI